MACEHQEFDCYAMVGRLSTEDGGPSTAYMAEIKVKCRVCGLPFRFIGLPSGSHFAEPRVSMDGTELRAPLEPATHEKFQLSGSYVMPPSQKQQG